ncbi:MAG: hypothetical protein RIK87_02365 [Fuerstiella sp.]
MSKACLKIRRAFVGFLVLLQLFLLPATQVLHLGCQHAHDHGPAATSSAPAGGEATSTYCLSSHCCHHCAKNARAADGQPTDSTPVHPSHDEDSCAVCQAAFAARVATVSVFALTTIEPVCEFLTMDSQTVYPTPRYCVLSRGPPTASLG